MQKAYQAERDLIQAKGDAMAKAFASFQPGCHVTLNFSRGMFPSSTGMQALEEDLDSSEL